MESTPQAILQLSVQYRAYRLKRKSNWIQLLAVLISIISMVVSWQTFYLKMPYFIKEKKPKNYTNQTYENGANEMKKGQLPFQSTFNLVWTIPLLALTIVPSIINITFAVGSIMHRVNSTAPKNNTLQYATDTIGSFVYNITTPQNVTEFSQYNPQIGFTVVGSILLSLAMLYSLLILIIYQVKNLFASHLSYYLVLNWATGPFGACVVIRPEANLLTLTSTASSFCHLLLLGSVYIIQHCELIDVQMVADNTSTAILAGFLVLSWISSIVLQVLSSEKSRQTFGLRTMGHSLSCPHKDAFLWACRNNYHDILKLCSEDHLKETDPAGQLTGMHIACQEGENSAIQFLYIFLIFC